MAAVQPAQPPLQLTCMGAGVANKTASKTVRTDSKISANASPFSGDNKTTTKTVTENYQQEFGDQLDIRLFSGDDRIRMPRAMVPELHGGQGGWFKLKNVVADPRSIRADISLAFLSNPKMFIDRVTGMISISGKAGDYSGQCQVIDPNAPARF
jgi:hypothetical protein